MTCKDWKKEWVGRLYEELEPDEEADCAAHLAGCAECRETLDGLARARRLLHAVAPAVPDAPRLVVLRPRSRWAPAWGFAAGAACGLLAFGLGIVAANRAKPGADVPPEPRTRSDEAAAVSDPAAAGREIEHRLATLRERVDRLEADAGTRSAAAGVTPADLRQAIDAVERRFARERAGDVEYILRSLAASEVRTDTWMDHTQEALTLLALSQDPRVQAR
jgi:hypothetical protein